MADSITFKDLVNAELNVMVGSKVEKWPVPKKFEFGKPIPRPEGQVLGTGNFVLASGYTPKDVDEFLAEITKLAGSDARYQHELLGQQIIEPIQQVVPYVEVYTPVFFMDVNYGDLEDNRIPIEDTVAMAWETHGDGEVQLVRVGSVTWTRPDFQRFNTGIDVPWDALKVAGWNFLARQMKRAAEALARKRDGIVQYVLDAAITANSGHFPAVATSMTKSSVDAVIKAAVAIGFPIRRAVVNAGVITDMASWLPSTTLAQYPQAIGESLLTNLYWSNYGNIEWYVNPFASSSYVYFGGTPDQIGWHQTRGQMATYSDIDIIRRRDIHTIEDPFHAWYVGNAYTLYRLNIQ